MPGIVCAILDPSTPDTEPRWRLGLELLRHHPEHVQETFSEPGFHLACVYHPAVCEGPRLLVTEGHVLAVYGNLYDDDLQGADGEALCQALLARFLQGGVDRLQHLNGRYDVAVWDRRARVLHWVGDRFGANRHYCHHRPGALHIACEVKALAPWLDAIKVDPAGLASMLTFGYHIGDLTILEGVHCLPNARLLAYRAGEDALRLERYWNYPYGEAEPLQGSEDELAEALHAHLTTALKRQLRGVDKILLPISGGLDSRTMAELLHQSGFDGEVMAYSYGQASSRDVRYGRAIARKLGYRHVAIPMPKNLVTYRLEEDAWLFDAEWSSELNWAVRFAYRTTKPDDLSNYCILSGMFGDISLGSARFSFREQVSNASLTTEYLRQAYYQVNKEYSDHGRVIDLFSAESSRKAKDILDRIIDETLVPLKELIPYYILMRAEFVHRQQRHTSMVSQSIETDTRILTPFLDTEFTDFTLRIPYDLFYKKKLYKRMIQNHLPNVARIPYADTAQPIARTPIRDAIHWRLEKFISRFPRLKRHLKKQAALFKYHDNVIAQRDYFLARANALNNYAPPLNLEKAAAYFHALLSGNSPGADQACAFLPPALYINELRRRLSGKTDGMTQTP